MGPKRVAAVLLALALGAAGCSPAASGVATAPVSTAAGPASSAGSAGSAGPTSSPGPAGSAADTPSGSAGGGDDGEALIVPGLTAPPALALPPLGAVGFRVDTARTTSVDFPADGSEATLTLTDGAGLTWKLVIPGDALDAPQAISMTALADLASADIPGRLAGGILLEPDGLAFVVPARLTVTGGSPGATPILLTGGQDGSAMQFALPANDAGGGAWISHFSSVVAVDADTAATLKQISEKLDRDEQAATTAATALLKEKAISVPEPPSLPLGCVSGDDATSNAKSLDAFVAAVGNPEMDLAKNLQAVERQRQLIGQSEDPTYALPKLLLGRLEKKALLLMRTYTGRPEKLQAVGAVVHAIELQIESLGSPATALLDQAALFQEASIGLLFNDLIEKHDYQKANAVMLVTKWANLNGESVSSEEVVRKLYGAMTFRLDVQLNVRYPSEAWLLTSTFPMRMPALDPDMTGSDVETNRIKKNYLTGEGTGEYVSFTSASSASMQAPKFSVAATLRNFDACAGTADLTVDRFYADAETYQFENGDLSLSMVRTPFELEFAKYLKGGVFTFPVQVHNLDPNMVDQTVEAISTAGTVQTEFHIVLTHTPKIVK